MSKTAEEMLNNVFSEPTKTSKHLLKLSIAAQISQSLSIMVLSFDTLTEEERMQKTETELLILSETIINQCKDANILPCHN